jgi:hypothetical protein
MKTAAIAATAMIAAMAAPIANAQPANNGAALAHHTADLLKCWQSKQYEYALRTNGSADVAAAAVCDTCDMQNPIENYGLSPSMLKIYKDDKDHSRAETRQKGIRAFSADIVEIRARRRWNTPPAHRGLQDCEVTAASLT